MRYGMALALSIVMCASANAAPVHHRPHGTISSFVLTKV
jgi:hypothetical protein